VVAKVRLSLVLASNSPRRRELLTRANFRFETVAPGIAEKFDPHLTLHELTLWNAIRKGVAVARAHPEKVVLAADTLVALDNEIIGKPDDLEDAARILARLSGRDHEVCSAVFVCHLAVGKSIGFHQVSQVRFRRLSKAEIGKYLAKVGPLDKAGGYAAQGPGAEIIAGIKGSFSNVVGLPMEQTVPILGQFGIEAQPDCL
jgi:septum formation protein